MLRPGTLHGGGCGGGVEGDQAAAVRDGKGQQVHIRQLARAVNTSRVDESRIEQALTVRPEFVSIMRGRGSQALHDVANRERIRIPGMRQERTHPFCVIGQDDQPSPPCSLNHAFALRCEM